MKKKFLLIIFTILSMFIFSNKVLAEEGACANIEWDERLNGYKFQYGKDYTICLYGFSFPDTDECYIVDLFYNPDTGEGNYYWNCREISKYISCDTSIIDQEILRVKLSEYYGKCPPHVYSSYVVHSGVLGTGAVVSGYNLYIELNDKDPMEYQFPYTLERFWEAEKNPKPGSGGEFDCKLIPDTLSEILNPYLTWIRILVPILIIFLGIVDFAQAVFATDEDKMKKAQAKFVRRLIIGVVIFLIPTFVNILIDLANKAWEFIGSDTCSTL